MQRWVFVVLLLPLGIGYKEYVQLAAHSPLAILMIHMQHARIQHNRAHQLARLYIVVLAQRCGMMIDNVLIRHGHRFIGAARNQLGSARWWYQHWHWHWHHKRASGQQNQGQRQRATVIPLHDLQSTCQLDARRCENATRLRQLPVEAAFLYWTSGQVLLHSIPLLYSQSRAMHWPPAVWLQFALLYAILTMWCSIFR